jgi:hypothetical protein
VRGQTSGQMFRFPPVVKRVVKYGLGSIPWDNRCGPRALELRSNEWSKVQFVVEWAANGRMLRGPGNWCGAHALLTLGQMSGQRSYVRQNLLSSQCLGPVIECLMSSRGDWRAQACWACGRWVGCSASGQMFGQGLMAWWAAERVSAVNRPA